MSLQVVEAQPSLTIEIDDAFGETRRHCKRALLQSTGVRKATVAVVEGTMLVQIVGGVHCMVKQIVEAYRPNGCDLNLIHTRVPA